MADCGPRFQEKAWTRASASPSLIAIAAISLSVNSAVSGSRNAWERRDHREITQDSGNPLCQFEPFDKPFPIFDQV
jgi:hypothetical protein